MKKLEPRTNDLHVFVCHGSRCTRNGAPSIRRELARTLARLGLKPRVSRTSCQGRCKQGCVVLVEGGRPRIWGQVRTEDVEKLAGKLVKALRRDARG